MKFRIFKRKQNKAPKVVPLASQYLDAVTGARLQSKLWRSLSVITAVTSVVFAAVSASLVFTLLHYVDRTKYILVPGLQKWTDAYPDKVTDEYISGLYEHIASKLSTWNYFNYDENMEDLFKRFFSPELTVRHKENLRLSGFMKTVSENKLSSMFKIDHANSVYKWCESLNAACGITVGREYIYSDGVPYQEQDVAYFMLGDAVRPEKIKPYSVAITRVSRTDLRTATAMLEAAEKGQLPKEQRLNEKGSL